MNIQPRHRIPLMLLGFAALGLGVAAGLAQLGWPSLLPVPSLLVQHGALMICGFFGTLISLERAVALGRVWVYAGPALAATATLTLLFSLPLQTPILLYLSASLVLSCASWLVYRQHKALFTATLAIGASCWSVGNVAWLFGAPALQIKLWWLMFLILTIAGERLELSRFLSPPPSVQKQFGLILIALLASLGYSAVSPAQGTWILGVTLTVLSLWLARNDIAKRTVKLPGLTRYIAVCLLSAYGWLATSGLIIVVYGGLQLGTLSYDAALHAITLGFVFGMVFGHTPIILPSVLKVRVAYTPAFYLHFALLQISLTLRLLGDLGIAPVEWRTLGGLLSAVAIAVFLLNTLLAVLRGRHKQSSFRRS